jgi:hypothetical protein
LQEQLQQQQHDLDAINRRVGEEGAEDCGEKVDSAKPDSDLETTSIAEAQLWEAQLWEPEQGSVGQLHSIVLWSMALVRWAQLVPLVDTSRGQACGGSSGVAAGTTADATANTVGAAGVGEDAAWLFWFYLCLFVTLLPDHFDAICLLNVVTMLPTTRSGRVPEQWSRPLASVNSVKADHESNESNRDSHWLRRIRVLAMTMLAHECSARSMSFDDVEGLHTFGVLAFDQDPEIAM